MAYIGSATISPITTQIRPRDEFVGNGFQREFVLAQEIPGGFESNVLAFVDNVPQEPITAYVIKDIERLTIDSSSTTSISNVQVVRNSASTTYFSFENNTVLRTSITALLNSTGVFTGRSGSSLRLQQRLISDNSLIAAMNISRADTIQQSDPAQGGTIGKFVGSMVSGSFDTTSSDLNYLIVYDVTQNNFIAFGAVNGMTPRTLITDLITSEKDYKSSSVSVETEAPKIADTITQASSGATGIIANATGSFVDIIRTSSASFATTGSGGGSITCREPIFVNYETDTISYETFAHAQFTTTNISTIKFKVLQFTGFPKSGQKVLINHMGGSNYQVNPTAGSVTDLALSENLKTFTVDKFTATSNQSVFTLTKTPVSVQSILVTFNGVVQTDSSAYNLQNGNQLVTAALNSGTTVNVLHLGFSTVSRNSFTDGSITASALQDLTITGNKIANSTITNAKLAAGVALSNIGYTPHNPASVSTQSYAGVVNFNDAINANANIIFPGAAVPSNNVNALDEYKEGDFTPTLIPAVVGGTPIALTGTGNFIKIGRVVKVSLKLVLTSLGAGNSGVITIGSLPYLINNSNNIVPEYTQIMHKNTTSMTDPYAIAIPNTLTLQITSSGFTNAQVSNLTATSELFVSLTYNANV